jgi:hypothetical protein
MSSLMIYYVHLPCYELGLRSWWLGLKMPQRGNENEGKDKSHRMGLALNIAQRLRAWQQ